MRLNQPSDGVILNGEGVRTQNDGYRRINKKQIDKTTPLTVKMHGHEHYVEKDEFIAGDQEITEDRTNYVNSRKKSGASYFLVILFIIIAIIVIASVLSAREFSTILLALVFIFVIFTIIKGIGSNKK